jgi:uncharacterized membrane protein YbhN (UPF0104 family)
MSGKKIAVWALKIGLTAIVVYFVGRQVVGQWDQVRDFDWQIQVWPLVLSVVLGITAFFIFSTCWRAIIAGFGHKVSRPKAFKILFLSDLGRYIPGKIWQVFGMLYLAKKEGVAPERAAASFVIIQLFAIPASFLVYVTAAQSEPLIFVDRIAAAGQWMAYLLIAVMVSFCLLLVFYPRPFVSMANFVLRKVGRPEAVFALDKWVALGVFAGYFLGWICYGVAYWLMLRSLLGPGAPGPVAAVGLFNGAYQIGYITLFAPGGLGPRELVMGELLRPFVAFGATVAVIARIWAILVEATAALIALTIRK